MRAYILRDALEFLNRTKSDINNIAYRKKFLKCKKGEQQ